MITYGSLCTGYDGLGQALRLAGVPIESRWMAENDPGMSEVLKHEHPDVRNAGDIKTAPWRLAPHVDLMSSGDPCQSISIAGRQLGRDDPRFLWPHVREAYRAVRPGGIFFENVANIVSHDGGRTLAERLAHLREDGYAVRWTVLGACTVGAPHHRHRWYAVAGYVGAGAPGAVRIGSKQLCGAPRSGGRLLLPSPMARDGDGRGEGSPEYWAERSRHRLNGAPLGAVVNLLPTPKANDHEAPGTKRIERGEKPWHDLPTYVALLPTPAARDGDERGTPSAEHAARRIADPKRSTNLEDAIAARLLPTPKASDAANGGPNQRDGAGNYYLPAARLLPTPTAQNRHGNDRNSRGELLLPGVAADPEVWGKYADAIALWERVTGIPAPEPTEVTVKGSRRLSAALPEWMMGLRPGLLTDRLSRGDALKGAGNGVVPLVAAVAWKLLTA